MEVFVLSFVIIVLAMLGLAVGTLARGSVLKGSCGGVAAAAGTSEGCEFCRASCKAEEIKQPVPGNAASPHRLHPNRAAMAGTMRDA